MLFLWILLYGLFFSLSEYAAALLNAQAWLTTMTMAVYIILLLCWICKTGQQQTVGLVFPCIQRNALLWLLPLIVLPLGNRIATSTLELSVHNVLLTLCICMAEELFFRGFLLSFLQSRQRLRSIFTAALIFALFHGGNLLSGWNPQYVMIQMFLAFSVGMYLCILRLFCGSLVPGIIAHFLVNLTAGSHLNTSFSGALILWGICAAIYLVCSLLLFSKIDTKHGG